METSTGREPVTYGREADGTAVVTIDPPERRNALNLAVKRRLVSILEALNEYGLASCSRRRPRRERSCWSMGWRDEPASAEAYRPWRLGRILLWELWDRISCLTLVRRGGASDMLPLTTAREITRRGPKAELAEFVGIGHLPALLTPEQIAPITAFLEQTAT
jgi:pimeloyl-ACP methyl ester carboxylesterase